MLQRQMRIFGQEWLISRILLHLRKNINSGTGLTKEEAVPGGGGQRPCHWNSSGSSCINICWRRMLKKESLKSLPTQRHFNNKLGSGLHCFLLFSFSVHQLWNVCNAKYWANHFTVVISFNLNLEERCYYCLIVQMRHRSIVSQRHVGTSGLHPNF